MKNSHLLIEQFGAIPSFHDAEIKRASYSATEGEKAKLELDFLVFEYSEKIDEKGYLIPQNEFLVTINFEDVRIDLWKWSNELDTIYEFCIEPIGDNDRSKFSNKIELPSVIGGDYGLEFVCNEIVVVNVIPYTQVS